jgi:hypothetical protein
MNWNDRIKTIQAMKECGCSFVRRLAAAWQCADDENSAKIEAAWPEYLAKYRQIAETRPTDADLTTAKPALDKQP